MQAKPKKYGEDLETMKGKGLGRLKTKQGHFPGSGQSMQGCILTYSRLLRGMFVSYGLSTEGTLISASTGPH